MTEKFCIVTLDSDQAKYKILNNPDDREILYCNTKQMTEKSCIVTLNSEQAKYKILNNPDDREILYCNSRQ